MTHVRDVAGSLVCEIPLALPPLQNRHSRVKSHLHEMVTPHTKSQQRCSNSRAPIPVDTRLALIDVVADLPRPSGSKYIRFW